MSQAAAAGPTVPLVIGRYALFDELAAGGMATVHLGRLLGPVGFGRTVAVKRLHSHYLKDEEFITMFMDEARIVARIRHPNVVPMVDVVQGDLGLFLVMEYVHGESLSRLMRTARKAEEAIPLRIIAAIMCGVLLGLHAAHDTKGPAGELLGVVHRDVSPQNIIVGADGTARVLDFGIAKAQGRAQVTREGQIKGKLAYMAPEQIRGQVDRRTDVFAAAVVLWELLAGRRLHEGAKEIDIVSRVVQGKFTPPSAFRPELDPVIDEIVLRGLASDPKKRFESARELALELERKVGLASPSEVGAWVERLGHDVLEARANLVMAMELAAGDLIAHDSNPPPPSLALPVNVLSSDEGMFPLDVDVMGLSGEPPSSSAVFTHAQTATDAKPVDPRRVPGAVWGVVAVFVALALVGVVLIASALRQRAAQTDVGTPSASASSLPRASLPPPPGPTNSVAWATPSAGTMELDPQSPAAPHAPPPRGSDVPLAVNAGSPAPPGATGATAPTGTSTASPPVALPKPNALPPPTGTAKKPKPNCEPPYTVDDVGHRHYKPECD